MKNYIQISLLAFTIVLGGTGAIAMAHAATMATMPVLYGQSGVAQNLGANYLSANNYYVVGGTQTGGHQVQYYGNGTFYDSSVGMYGGSVYNPSGMAGVGLNYINWFNYNNTTATMPALFNQNNQQVNATGSYLSAGYYYLGGGPSAGGVQVYYYGNGVYYNSNTQTYSGSINNPNGTAGVSLGL